MKKIIIVLLVMLSTVINAADIPGRPDVRPLKNKDIVAITRGFVSQVHNGIDFSCFFGTPVYAAADGEVFYAGNGLNGYGLVVILKHKWIDKTGDPQTAYTLYAHLSKQLVLEQKEIFDLKTMSTRQVIWPVKKGEKIALSGNSGHSDGAHLHYELRNEFYIPIWNGTYQSEKLSEEKIE